MTDVALSFMFKHDKLACLKKIENPILVRSWNVLKENRWWKDIVTILIKSSTRQQTQTYAGHFFVMAGLLLNLSIKLLFFHLFLVFFFLLYYFSVSRWNRYPCILWGSGIEITFRQPVTGHTAHRQNESLILNGTMLICLQPVTSEVVVVVDAKVKKERSLGTLTPVSFYHHTMTRCLFTVPPLHIEDVEIQS